MNLIWSYTHPSPRNRSLRCLRKGIVEWRSCVAVDRLLPHWGNAILHRAGFGRNGRLASCCWVLLSVLNALFGSGVGLRHGMELRAAMADRPTAGSRSCIHYGQLLGLPHLACCLGRHLLDHHHYHQFLWCQGIWGSRVRVLDHQGDRSHWIHVRTQRPMRETQHVLTVILSILGIILDIGGGPNGDYLGGRYWQNPGAFNNGFKGLCSVFVTAAFAFAGTELVGLAAAETRNPRKSLPTAVKQVFWRITLFYIVSLSLVGLLVPYNDLRLIGSSSSDAKASPFVIAIKNAGITGLDSVMNVVIMIAVLSVGNSAIFGSSRTLAALAEQGQAPQILAYIDVKGRPLMAIIVASTVGLLAFIAASNKQTEAFIWMQALSGLSSIFTWGSICLAHIRFRRAWRLQGHEFSELAFRSQAGVVGSWIGFTFNILVIIAQFWTGLAPISNQDGSRITGAAALTENWFKGCLALPVVLAFYIYYKIRYRTPFMRCQNMDLRTGVRELNLQELLAEEEVEKAAWPKWKKAYKFLC